VYQAKRFLLDSVGVAPPGRISAAWTWSLRSGVLNEIAGHGPANRDRRGSEKWTQFPRPLAKCPDDSVAWITTTSTGKQESVASLRHFFRAAMACCERAKKAMARN